MARQLKGKYLVASGPPIDYWEAAQTLPEVLIKILQGDDDLPGFYDYDLVRKLLEMESHLPSADIQVSARVLWTTNFNALSPLLVCKVNDNGTVHVVGCEGDRELMTCMGYEPHAIV